MNTENEPMSERFEGLFKIALVLLGVLSSIEFQYFLQIWGPTVALRMSAAPYILIIPVWFLKEIIKEKLPTKIWLLLSEFCYELWGLALGCYLWFFWAFQMSESWWSFGVFISVALCIIVLSFVIYAYYLEYKTVVVEYYKSIGWILLRAMFLIFAFIFTVVVFFIRLLPVQQNTGNFLIDVAGEIPQCTISAILAIVSGITVAVLTHYLASRREGATREARLVGWLKWLSSFLDQAEKGMVETKGKLPWWADHTLQAAGDAFAVLSKKEAGDLNTLLSRAWSDDIWSLEGAGVELDSEKVNTIRKLIDGLITDLSPKDP